MKNSDPSLRPKCNCKTGCSTKRCACFREGQPCSEDTCGCSDCANPLNGLDVENMSACAIDHVEKYKALSQADLDEKIELPCGCGALPLRELIKGAECPGCKELYWYSFCWGQAAQDNCSWHCSVCGVCRDWREWHCDGCNRCVYGVSLPCPRCG